MVSAPLVQRLIMWGAKGQARVLAEIATAHAIEVIALFDRVADCPSPLPGVPVLGGEEAFEDWAGVQENIAACGAIAAIGGHGGRDRLMLMARFVEAGLRLPSLIHLSASIAPSAQFGANCQIMAGVVISSACTIGDAVIVNTKASVDHECRIGPGTHIAPGATLCGEVTTGLGVFVGAGATVLPRVQIGDDAVIGAGAVVTRDVKAGQTVKGVPAIG